MNTIELISIPKTVRGYWETKDGALPPHTAFINSIAMDDFMLLQEASKHLFEYTSIYRSLRGSRRARLDRPLKKRKYVARPTDSGHNYGISMDVYVDQILKVMADVKLPIEPNAWNINEKRRIELEKAYKKEYDAGTIGLWTMRAFFAQYGFSCISTERWHFNYAQGYSSSKPWVDAVYPIPDTISNEQIDRAIQVWHIKNGSIKEFQKKNFLVADGIIGPKTRRYLYLTQLEVTKDGK